MILAALIIIKRIENQTLIALYTFLEGKNKQKKQMEEI